MKLLKIARMCVGMLALWSCESKQEGSQVDLVCECYQINEAASKKVIEEFQANPGKDMMAQIQKLQECGVKLNECLTEYKAELSRESFADSLRKACPAGLVAIP